MQGRALDVDRRQPTLESVGQPPGAAAEDRHDGGTKVIRTANASTKTPTASPRAICWMVLVPAGMKATKTLVMISAAAVTTREEARKPSRTDSWALPEAT